MRRVAVLVAVVVTGAAGCADDDGGAGDIADPIDVAEVGVTAIAQADVMACQSDRTVLETAIDAYDALQGTSPTSDADLVTAGLLREESTLWDVTPDGSIVPAPGSTC